LSVLDPTDAERAEARTVLLTGLPDADPEDIVYVVWAVPGLVTTDVERAEARTALLKIVLTTPYTGLVDRLVEVLLVLVTTDAERAEARTSLLQVLDRRPGGRRGSGGAAARAGPDRC
jgi:hypothetical protein